MIQTAVKFPNICQITGLGKSTNKLEKVFWKSFKKVHGNSDSLDFVSEITGQTMLHKQLGDFSVNHETGQQLDTSSLGFALKVSKKKKSYLLEASRQILWKYSPSVLTLYTDNSVGVCLKHSKKTSPKPSFSTHHPCAPAAFFQETDKWCATPVCWQGFLPPLPMCLLLLPIPPPKPDLPDELWAVTAAITAEHWWGCMGDKHRRRSLAETLNT